MAMANMNLIGVLVTKLWPVQVLACGGGGDGDCATKNIISPKFSNFGDIINLPDVGVFPLCRQEDYYYCRIRAGIPYIYWRFCLLTSDSFIG